MNKSELSTMFGVDPSPPTTTPMENETTWFTKEEQAEQEAYKTKLLNAPERLLLSCFLQDATHIPLALDYGFQWHWIDTPLSRAIQELYSKTKTKQTLTRQGFSNYLKDKMQPGNVYVAAQEHDKAFYADSDPNDIHLYVQQIQEEKTQQTIQTTLSTVADLLKANKTKEVLQLMASVQPTTTIEQEFPKMQLIDDKFTSESNTDFESLWEGLIMRNHLTLLYGQAKKGKSTFIRFLCRLMGKGGYFISDVHPAKVMLCAEDPQPLFRLYANKEKFNEHGNCYYFPLTRVAHQPLEKLKLTLHQIKLQAQESQIDLVVIDTATTLLPLNFSNNDHEAIMMFLNIVKSVFADSGMAILLTTHMGKSAENKTPIGSTAWQAVPDVLISFETTQGANECERKITLDGRMLYLFEQKQFVIEHKITDHGIQYTCGETTEDSNESQFIEALLCAPKTLIEIGKSTGWSKSKAYRIKDSLLAKQKIEYDAKTTKFSLATDW